jgi:hypothetical protein
LLLILPFNGPKEGSEVPASRFLFGIKFNLEVMMKMHHLSRNVFFATCLLLAFASCKRDRTTWDGELTSTIDNNFADSEFSSIRNMVDTEGRADSVVYGKTSGTQGIFCPGSSSTVTILNPSTVRMVLDFASGTNCLDGRLRAGKLKAEFTGKWKDAGSQVVITPDGYSVNGYAFSFTATITFNGRDANSHLNWTTVVSNAVLTHPTNGTIQWNSTHNTTWTAGEGSLDPNTYVYEVTGSSNGVARNLLTFVASIDQPLRIELNCQWIVGGVWTITPQDRDPRSIDYGNNGCDNQATLTVGNYTTAVTLP